MTSERFEFTAAGTGQYVLMQEIAVGELPGVVTHVTEDHLQQRTTVGGIYARVEGGLIVGLTCEELGRHDWHRRASLFDKNYWECCTRCGQCRDSGVPIPDDVRDEAWVEYNALRASLAAGDIDDGWSDDTD